ncbi:superoxide dismutase [Clostridium botulinum]|uniref:Superoxide dismutase n=2 Tax=Clostridium botulinum TaxID=1491 RepID=A0A0A2HMM5_CLOBO|nr:superoxide dismutase [Clostridium botulinum]AJD27177.1 iron/manganese superoxide dismutase, alpha-hairpin domain protein [Clostridium botulinum CDC_297]EPS50193.1 Mn/Fe superoxide dismutase [Clostridium botulinum A1 str. CFSAN002368]ACQ55221.1 superoxide dismutase [Clostridium botulinum Ba4 str. 657]AJE10389.1 iron/manganese superoxide dismutase, alpha-hairpin domain protein [Clostridium botulinum CDC_1436]APR01851.1 iron/manganese superoxide dismutase, alpha-hairpin domain protein [Clostri
MAHTLPNLNYDYNALEPHYDEQTLKIHHDIHHKTYVDGLNKAEQKLQEARESGDFTLIKHWEREIAFHGSGHILHTLFWENMTPNGNLNPEGSAIERIKQDFGDYEKFKKQFTEAAIAVEGSGWTILAWNPMFQKLVILQAEKHQNLTQWGVVPLLILDLWEHAYYLKYQNRRAEFINAWWNIVNWDIVNTRYDNAIK